MSKIFIEKYKEKGWKYFYKGLAPTLLRAFPTNAVILAVFD